jgi:glycerate dehydrogenase
MKIVILDRKTLGEDIDIDVFSQFGQVTSYDTSSYEQTLPRVKDADIVLTNKVLIDKNIMEQSNIKLICITATGTNNVDLKYAKEKGIEVKNAAGYSTASVAQVTFSLVLELIQNIRYYSNYAQSGQWSKSDIFTHLDKPFFELENKNWGIIGLGEIGRKVAHIAKGFGCNVNYYSTSGTNNNTTYNSKNLEDLLKSSDIISIHCPLNDATRNLINASNLPLLKQKALLVNVGRGGIINEQDLANFIDRSSLFCALDVLEKEPMEETNPLNFIQNKHQLIITPHIAWGSIESRQRLIQQVINNIKEYIK